ncbi:MAG TPA: hypothetical protein EYQ74_01370 [Planctomycetes bacterium]|nr:hypothetical protein [Planctomycetota bacterium]HIK61926.1 hypothetical protein [Planctomycetota bacterium]
MHLPAHNSAEEGDPLPWGTLWLIAAAGVFVRLCLLWIVGDLDLQSDEANYVYLGIAWNHFGFYLDQHRYLWPPGYSWLMAGSLNLFGENGMLAVKYLQVLASASIGMTTMLFAVRLFGLRAARIAGWIWVAYLPLAAFTHLLWNETLFSALFLPGLYQIMRLMQCGDDPRATRRTILAGLCLAGSLYMKESPQFLVLVLALLLVPFAGSLTEGVRRSTLLLLVVGVCILPWGLRNQNVYGSFIPLGTSLGENAFNGLNQDYRNFDLIPIDVERERRGLPPTRTVARHWFDYVEPIPYRDLQAHMDALRKQTSEALIASRERVAAGGEPDPRAGALQAQLLRNTSLQERWLDPVTPLDPDALIEFAGDPGWLRAEPPEVINTAQRSEVNMANGLRFAREHPGWYGRSRIRKLADLLTPTSFFTRHQALGHYDMTPLGGNLLRKLTSLWAIACPVLVLLLGIVGYVTVLRSRPAWLLFGCTLGYFLCTTLLVAMSRFRIPTVPLLIVLAAGVIVHHKTVEGRTPKILAALAALLVAFLWWVTWPENSMVFGDMVWSRYNA